MAETVQGWVPNGLSLSLFLLNSAVYTRPKDSNACYFAHSCFYPELTLVPNFFFKMKISRRQNEF